MEDFRSLGLKRAVGYGSVQDVPTRPRTFEHTFESYVIPAGEVSLHAVIGGSGRPLLLLGGWPQNWYAWRHLMLPLAAFCTVIAVDPRGVGLSDKPKNGHDSVTLASDMFALMDTLCYEHFLYGRARHRDVDSIRYGYDQPGRITRIALGEATIPGVSVSPPLLSDDRWLSDFLWHFQLQSRAGSERISCFRARRYLFRSSICDKGWNS